MTRTITTHSEIETAAAGRDLASRLSAGSVVLLFGDLGAGKTAFVRGLAEGLGVPAEDVSSPTFTIMQEYRGGRLPLFHVDLYRLNDSREVDDLGMDEIAADGVLAFSEVIGLLGKRPLPVLPPWGTGLLAGPLRSLGFRIPDEVVNQLRFGRGVDNRLLKATGFRYGYTTRETVLKLGEHLRLAPVMRGVEQTYTYEREVEEFLRWSPYVRREHPGERGGVAADREPLGI